MMTEEKLNEGLAIFLEAPDTQLDAKTFPLIQEIIEMDGGRDKAMKMLSLLDCCVCFSLASGFCVEALRIMLESYCKDNDINEDELRSSPDRKDWLKNE